MHLQKCLAIACMAIFLALNLAAEESAEELELRGSRALNMSQSRPDAIIAAATYYGKAAEIYAAKGNDAKATELNSFLYWCKKKMTLQQMDAFLKGGNPDAPAVAKRMAEIENSTPAVSEAKAYFTRADNFAKSHPNEHLLIAVRFYEVADRFKGSDLSLAAQDRSLKEIMLAQKVLPVDEPAADSKPKTQTAVSGRKLPIPGAAELKQAEKFAREIYAADLAKTAPADKLELAKKLSAQADETKDDAVGKYQLLIMSSQLAAAGSDLERVLALGDKVSAEYDDRNSTVLRTALGALIGGARDPNTTRAAMAIKLLLDKPDDPNACTNAGRYFLIKGDFARALPLLAKSSHPVLSKLAQQDLTSPTTATAQADLGDRWWDGSEKLSEKDEKQRMKEHAGFWYAKAAPTLPGLNKIRIEKRIKEVPPIEEVATATPATPVATQPGKAPAAVASLAPPFPPGIRPVDVLTEVDVANDSFIGLWKMEGGELIAPHIEKKVGTILMPYRLPESYRIDVELARVSGSTDGFVVGMTTGRNPFAFNLDDGKRSYLLTVDGHLQQPYKYHNTTPDATFNDGPLITDNKVHYLSIEKGKNALTVHLDNKLILNWKADYTRLGPSYWNRLSKQHLLFAARDSVWKISKVLVFDLEGKGEINHVDMRGVKKEEQ